MKKIFALFAINFLISSVALAATGSGHAQAELTNPLVVTNALDVKFGTISIDPSAGPQSIEINAYSQVTCPPAYVCSGATQAGAVFVDGAPNTSVHISVTGSTATLSNGLGETLVFDPYIDLYSSQTEATTKSLNASGRVSNAIGGTITFTGNEIGGVYNTTKTGGSGYTVTVNY